MPRLTLIQAGKTLWTHDFDKDYITIGRHAFADIPLDSALVSRHHAVIRYSVKEGGLIVEDAGSSNGIRVNGEAVKSRVLENGDRIQVGGYLLVLEDKGSVGGRGQAIRQRPHSGIQDGFATLELPGSKG